MEAMYHIDDEDEELTFEDFLDKKMGEGERSGAETIYTLACSCLHERRNKRPLIKQVRPAGLTDWSGRLGQGWANFFGWWATVGPEI